MNAIDPTTPLTVTLEAQQWNQIIGVLFDTPNLPLPHRLVGPLIQRLSDQVQSAAGQAAAPLPLANGEDTYAPH